MRKYLLLSLLLFAAATMYAQGQTRVTGKLIDAVSQEPLISATVSVKGTSTATTTALDGSFKISVDDINNTTLVITYVGYTSKEVTVTGKELGTITVDPASSSLKEVGVTANPSLKINRQTPVAASSVGQIYIEEHGSGAEFPELMKMTPGVTVTRGGGGYGDSRINIRGFSSNNVALLINGIPVNDVEAGKIYWNDWAGLEDVTTSMQVQRGLGASTVAVPSMGGTIDITTRASEPKEGGTVAQTVGSYGAQKTLVSYSTGLTQDGWAASFLLSKNTGNSPSSEGEYYTGYNYFANVSKNIGTNQTLSFSYMGASQRHGQLYSYNYVSTFQNAPQGTRYNSDWGYLNGQVYSAEQNYYNKPLASINYDWKINATTSWSTVLYGTWGTGAADYLAGTYGSLLPGQNGEVPRTGGTFSPINFNALINTNVANNNATGNGAATAYMQDVVNNHQQYGAISTIKKTVGNITYLAGVDLRDYTGEHFDKADNLLGSSYIQDTYTVNKSTGIASGNINNQNNQAGFGQKFNNDYTYDVLSEGAYAQAEYSKDAFTAFLTLSGSNTSNRRIDYFNYTPGNQDGKWINFLGYQAKGGANYNIDAQNNIYANIGYIQRAPLVGSLYLNKNNTVNTGAVPEKLFDYELGYGFTSALFSADVNAYRTSYRDRSQVFSIPNTTDPSNPYYANVNGLNEMHEGIEADAKFRPVQGVVLGGMLSVGDYYYTSNTGAVQVTSNNTVIKNISGLDLKGLKIGDPGSSVTGSPSATSAQTTAGGTLDVKVLSHVTVGAEYLYYCNYYAAYNPSKIIFEGYQPYKIPNVGTLDLDVVFRFKMAGFDAEFVGNVYNVLGTKYISDAYESSPTQGLTPAQRIGGIPATNTVPTIGVNYGAPRFYMTTLKIKF